MTTVVNRRSTRPSPGDVYIGRPSRWGNPFVIGRHGTRDQVIQLYRDKLWTDLLAGRLALDDLAQLAGKRLVCWCAPAPCHGDVLAAAAEWVASGGDRTRADWARPYADDLEADRTGPPHSGQNPWRTADLAAGEPAGETPLATERTRA